jgi:hypothetical protein
MQNYLIQIQKHTIKEINLKKMFGLTKLNRSKQLKDMNLKTIKFYMMLKYGIIMDKLFLFLP